MANQPSPDVRAFTVRPPAAALDSAKVALAEHGVEMRAFISACLAAVAADPGGFLPHLAGHWPAPNPRGRAHSGQGTP